MVEDLMSIVHCFSCRLYGLRKYKKQLREDEDLTKQINSSKPYRKDQKRRLSGWVKGVIRESLEVVSRRRGSSLVMVNASYTSQMDSRHGVLLGLREGEKFYCFDGVVLDADHNAACSILSRLEDVEIRLWTPHYVVKSILLRRTRDFKDRLGLLNQDSSCSEVSINGERIAFR